MDSTECWNVPLGATKGSTPVKRLPNHVIRTSTVPRSVEIPVPLPPPFLLSQPTDFP